MSDIDDVQAASERFYSALNRMAQGEKGSMAEIWETDGACSAMHPIGGRVEGWAGIAGSFDDVAGLCSGGAIEMQERRLQVGGDLAYETGMERGQVTMAGHALALDHRVTNLYHRGPGGWRMVHHHTDISPALTDLLAEMRRAEAG